MNDRLLGYAALLLLVFFFIVSIGSIVYTLTLPVSYRISVFDNVKSLRREDMVFVRGSVVGEVAGIEWKNGHAYVKISSKTPLEIRRNYSLTVVDIGVMGDRVLNLDYGTPDQPLVPVRDTLVGTVAISTPDAVGLAYKMREVTLMFVDVTTLLLNGDRGRPSLVRQYGDVVRLVDSTTGQLENIARQLDVFSRTRADSLYRLVDEAAVLSATVVKKTPAFVQTATQQLASLSKLLDDVESLLKQVTPFIQQMKGPEAQDLLRQLGTLDKSTNELRSIIHELQNQGLKLRVWPF